MDLSQETMLEIAVYDLLTFLGNANIRFIISFFCCKALIFGILYSFYNLRILSNTCIFHQHINEEKEGDKSCIIFYKCIKALF